MFKKYGKMALILMLVVIIALMPCLNAYAFAITASSTAIMALMALSGVTLMTANIPDSVAQNMYRDISTIASNTSHALYDSANAILDFTSDYSSKVATATGNMIEVSGINLSNAIGSFKNYLTYKNINSAYDGITISNVSNSLNLQKMAICNVDLSKTEVQYGKKLSATSADIMTSFNSALSQVLVSNTVLHSTKNFYNMSLDGFKANYADFNSLDVGNFASLSAMATALSTAYDWLTGTFGKYTTSVKFNDIRMLMNGEMQNVSVEFISFLVTDGFIITAFVRDASNSFVGYFYSDGELYKNRSWSSASFSALPLAYYIGDTTASSQSKIMSVLPMAGTSSSYDFYLRTYPAMRFCTFNNGSFVGSSSYSDVFFGDTVGFSSSAVSVPRVDTSLDGQDVYGVPDIPDSVISGQYNPDVADKIGAVVGGADVVGLNIPVDTGADVFNPSIDALIGSGTLTSDVVIDGTTISTGTDVITGVDTAVGDLVTTSDTVLDLTNTPGTPGTPSFPDVFPGLWGWVNGLVDNALQWFIFCGDVFGALPGAIKYTFLGGMTSILAVGVIKKLLF